MKKIQIPFRKIKISRESFQKEHIKAYWKGRHERRQRILEKRKNSAFARKMQPVYRWMNRLSLLGHALLAFLLNLVIETLSRHSLIKAWEYMVGSPVVFFYNTLLIFVTLSVVYLFRRRIFARMVISFVWLLLGICNGVLLMKRVTPFNGQDMKVLAEALSLATAFYTVTEIILMIVMAIAVLVVLISLWRRGGQYTGKIHRVPALFFAVSMFVLLNFVTNQAIDKRVLSTYFGNIAFAYEDYGCPYCFLASLTNTGISEPNGYSKETIDAISDNGEITKTTLNDENQKRPNILFIQWESFFDTDNVEWLKTSEDPTPTFHQLAKNYSTGYFKVPSIGAGTSNTEFEVLTGMNMRYFGPGEYPYKTILKETTCESAATALESLGYGTHALHNNGGNFYSRADVYNNMGFDTFTSKEFMNILQYTENGWAKDDILQQCTMDALNMTEGQDFVFDVTVQCHGDYPTEQVLDDPRITVSGTDTQEQNNQWTYYVNQLYETDQMIAGLLKELEERGEPTVVVIYGDHLPTLGLSEEDVSSRYLYNTNYVVWDNIGLQKQDRNIPSYQIMADVFDRLGIHSGTVFNYHQRRRKTKNYLADLEMLQYDMLYGKQYVYGEEGSPITEGHMEMGTKDVTVSDITAQLNGTYSIYGEDFTRFSKVYINEEKQDTTFLNNTRLDLGDSKLKDGDTVVISQVGSKSRVFRSSAVYVYYNEQLLTEDAYKEQKAKDDKATSQAVDSGKTLSTNEDTP